MKKALTFFENFLYSEVPMMSLSLACCLVIVPINILWKSFKTSGSSRSILCKPSDYGITSDRINLESSDRYKRKVEYYNIWVNGTSACRKVLKLSNTEITDWTNIGYSLLIGYLNAFTNHFSLLGFSSGSFPAGSSSKLKLDRKYDCQESHCIKVLTKHFSTPNRLVETWLIAFLTLPLLKFINSFNCFFHFAHLRKWQYMPITKSTLTQSSLNPFPALKCAKWQGQPTSKIFGHLAHFVFSEAGCYVV